MALDTRTNVDKEINEGILRTYLGVDDPTGIDFGTYKTLLREKIAAARMGGSDMDSSDISYLTNEFLRIKNIEPAKAKKIDINKFVKKAEEKKKKTKVSAQKLFEAARDTAASSAPKAGKVSNQKLLPPSKIIPTPQDEVDDFYGQDLDDLLNEIRNDKEETQAVIDDLKKESDEQKKILNMLSPSFSTMEKNLEDILGTTKKQSKLKDDEIKSANKESQVTYRKDRETELETTKPKQEVKKVEKKLEPVTGFIDMILNFLKNIALGGAVTALMNIIENPAKTLNPIIEGINSAIDFVNGFLSTFVQPISDIATAIVNGLRGGLNLIEGAFNFVMKLFGTEEEKLLQNIPNENFESPKIEIPKIPLIEAPEQNQTETTGMKSGGVIPQQNQTETTGMKSGGVIPQQTTINNFTYEQGGKITNISGETVSGMGPDTRLIAAQPGEIVMSKSAVQYYGADNLLAMNKEGGGTNKPKAGKVMGYRGGGMVSGGYISDDERAALDVLAKYESGSDGYQAVNQYGDKAGRGNIYRFSDGSTSFVGSFNKMSMHEGRSLTDLTVGEVKQLQYDDGSLSMRQWVDQGKLHAVGRYQFVGNTLPGVAKRAGIPDTAKFDKTTQDKMAIQLIKERGISPWVGPSDKATPAERAIVAKVRNMGSSTTMSRPSQIASSPSTPSTSSAPAALVSSPPASSKSTPPPPPAKKKTRAILATTGGGSGAGSQSSSGSNAGQTRVDGFSPIDLNNPELIVIKSIYNVVG